MYSQLWRELGSAHAAQFDKIDDLPSMNGPIIIVTLKALDMNGMERA